MIRTGTDNVLGNTIVVKYDQAINHRTKKTADVIARYYHLKQISVKDGDEITKDTLLGQYGNTGKYSAGAHLHLEFDSSTDSPLHSKTLGGSSNIIKASITDTQIDPEDMLHVKISDPDRQEIKVDTSAFKGQRYAAESLTRIPKIQ